MIAPVAHLASRLNERREALGLSCAALAQRTGLSLRTVQRALSGNGSDPSFSTIASLAEGLGVGVRFEEMDADVMRRRQASEKAERLVALVQGTAALESQGLSAAALRDLRNRMIHDLLAGSNHKLWAE